MSTPVEQLTFTPTLTNTSSTLADWALMYGLNVKNFGAVGDGVHDDTDNIQACFDAAYGGHTGATAHGQSGYQLNQPVFIPAGNYRVTKTLRLLWIAGSSIIGAGSGCTRIFYDGPVPGPAYWVYGAGALWTGGEFMDMVSSTPVIMIDGFNRNLVQGITFEHVGTGAGAPGTKEPNTSCINYTWIQWSEETPAKLAEADALVPEWRNQMNTTSNMFRDVVCKGGTYGFLVGAQVASIPSATSPLYYDRNSQCDTDIYMNCGVDNCYKGHQICSGNALIETIIGGTWKNCGSNAIYMRQSNYGWIDGCTFSNNCHADSVNGGDIQHNFSNCIISNCHSTSKNFGVISGTDIILDNIVHDCDTAGYFCRTVDNHYIIDNCYSKTGNLLGKGAFFVRNNSRFGLGGIPISGGMDLGVREWTLPNLTFAQLPTGAENIMEGLQVNISDSPTNLWGQNVTVGLGGNHVRLRWNSANWTVMAK